MPPQQPPSSPGSVQDPWQAEEGQALQRQFAAQLGWPIWRLSHIYLHVHIYIYINNIYIYISIVLRLAVRDHHCNESHQVFEDGLLVLHWQSKDTSIDIQHFTLYL